MNLQKMLFGIAFCALVWSRPQVVASHWYYASTIQPSPSFQTTPSGNFWLSKWLSNLVFFVLYCNF